MARKRKVDPLELDTLLKQGLTMEAIGERFGVGKGTICKNVKALVSAKSQDLVLRAATKVNNQQLNASKRLERISGAIEGELSYIQKTIKKSSGEERRGWEDSLIKHCAEIRKQLGLQLEIFSTLWNAEQTQDFQETVLEVLGEIDESVREKVIKRLRERRSYRSAVEFSGSKI